MLFSLNNFFTASFLEWCKEKGRTAQAHTHSQAHFNVCVFVYILRGIDILETDLAAWIWSCDLLCCYFYRYFFSFWWGGREDVMVFHFQTHVWFAIFCRFILFCALIFIPLFVHWLLFWQLSNSLCFVCTSSPSPSLIHKHTQSNHRHHIELVVVESAYSVLFSLCALAVHVVCERVLLLFFISFLSFCT